MYSKNNVTIQFLVLAILSVGFVSCSPDKKAGAVHQNAGGWSERPQVRLIQSQSIQEIKPTGNHAELEDSLSFFSEPSTQKSNRIKQIEAVSLCSSPLLNYDKQILTFESVESVSVLSLLPPQTLLAQQLQQSISCNLQLTLTNFEDSTIQFKNVILELKAKEAPVHITSGLYRENISTWVKEFSMANSSQIGLSCENTSAATEFAYGDDIKSALQQLTDLAVKDLKKQNLTLSRCAWITTESRNQRARQFSRLFYLSTQHQNIQTSAAAKYNERYDGDARGVRVFTLTMSNPNPYDVEVEFPTFDIIDSFKIRAILYGVIPSVGQWISKPFSMPLALEFLNAASVKENDRKYKFLIQAQQTTTVIGRAPYFTSCVGRTVVPPSALRGGNELGDRLLVLGSQIQFTNTSLALVETAGGQKIQMDFLTNGSPQILVFHDAIPSDGLMLPGMVELEDSKHLSGGCE